ncbi:MAG: hypothetical protein A2729_04575 [Candidatus Buchananbacteria bacterium RIFCSPHIGHO2_01_FULL_39_14]|uniref:Type II secretion system protein J n=2 Tax=Candidatus Buchananiibacteriota TaxID=1817903 RepID=A0A1G1YPU5_9BACT|nr:MAG: hypothetical protein A2729_04575 [Candidatus Buchananbacteria bacterium RIFCSPHIGHO2_01_FULL_39_14]OGY49262.1 MAG: hypothetical protein A3D39_03130 [Candidatus Buchananbacteria bacterium RIFCSPHIGHO2_02_FULL_39_17]OGY54324.1 MAG: hypothetical protein A2912_04800 [Candidatus Buchananbacteria bacterium RIFCSPLOWO2_01_FULL_40_23b]
MAKSQNIYLKGAGFTLTELLIAVIIGMLIIMVVSSTFLLNQKVFRKGNIKAELSQNARIVLDLMSREIRQAAEIVTTLPSDDTDPNLLAHELEFEDGHTTSQIQYLKYLLANNQLKRQTIVYYFDADPSIYVHWNDVDSFGAPTQNILEEKIIGENFTSLDFFGNSNINIILNLNKGAEQIEMKAVINPRNN